MRLKVNQYRDKKRLWRREYRFLISAIPMGNWWTMPVLIPYSSVIPRRKNDLWYLLQRRCTVWKFSERVNDLLNCSLLIFTSCKWCSVKTDSGLAGTLGFQYSSKYIRPSGLFVKAVFRTGYGWRNIFAGCPRLSEQMEWDRNRKRKFRRFEPWKMRISGWKPAVLSRFSTVLPWKNAPSARLCKKEKSSKPACLLDFLAES